MRLSPISIACPQCGSKDVLYSCQPTCCFNHVCNNCYTTFELETTKVGELPDPFAMPPEPEPSSPTAPCARCGEAKVFAIVDTEEPAYFCVSCKALLTLSLTEIAPGQ
jgi:hypothetical protein